jgi:acetylornithine deacetylase
MNLVVKHLSNLIRIPSVSALSNRPVVDYARRVLMASGWSTRELPYRDDAGVEKVNLIAAPPGQNVDAPEAALAFVCHTDTVPYAAEWKRAIEPVANKGMLHGCGSCDVKGFLACLLTAASGISSSNLRDSVRIVLTADEEIGCVGASHLIGDGVFRPRSIVIGEPTSLHPARAGKGYCLGEVLVRGKEAHSAHCEEGVSAIYGAARLITRIEEFAVECRRFEHGFFSPRFTTINVGTLHGGTAKNIVPGECRFQLEWRPIPGQSMDAVPNAVRGIIAEMEHSDPEFHAEINVLRQQAGFETSADSPLVRSMELLTGRSAISIPFGSEASLFAPLAEEVIVFGPGDMRTAHSSRECVPIAELDEAVTSIGRLMREL